MKKEAKRGKRKQEFKKENFFKKHYSLSWQYIKESRNYVLFALFLFLFFIIVALFYQPPEVVKIIKEFVEKILKETSGLNWWQLSIYILNNNLGNSFMIMLLGVFFGIFPVFTAVANGYVLGFIAEKSVQTEGLSVLLRLFPHGIFELPAVIFAIALGIKLGMFWFAQNRKKEFLRRLEQSLRVFLFVILPLLIIAAIIEGILINAIG